MKWINTPKGVFYAGDFSSIQAVLNGIPDQRTAVFKTQFVDDLFAVCFGSMNADVECNSNFFIGITVYNEFQYFLLPVSQ